MSRYYLDKQNYLCAHGQRLVHGHLLLLLPLLHLLDELLDLVGSSPETAPQVLPLVHALQGHNELGAARDTQNTYSHTRNSWELTQLNNIVLDVLLCINKLS